MGDLCGHSEDEEPWISGTEVGSLSGGREFSFSFPLGLAKQWKVSQARVLQAADYKLIFSED